MCTQKCKDKVEILCEKNKEEKRKKKAEVEKEQRRTKVDLGLNKSPVTKQTTQFHSLFPGCVRVCPYKCYFAGDRDCMRGTRQLRQDRR